MKNAFVVLVALLSMSAFAADSIQTVPQAESRPAPSKVVKHKGKKKVKKAPAQAVAPATPVISQ